MPENNETMLIGQPRRAKPLTPLIQPPFWKPSWNFNVHKTGNLLTCDLKGMTAINSSMINPLKEDRSNTITFSRDRQLIELQAIDVEVTIGTSASNGLTMTDWLQNAL